MEKLNRDKVRCPECGKAILTPIKVGEDKTVTYLCVGGAGQVRPALLTRLRARARAILPDGAKSEVHYGPGRSRLDGSKP